MGCRQYRNALSEGAAGTLAPDRQREINEHLARCSGCAEALDRLKRSMAAIDRALLDSAKPEPSPELMRGLEHRLQAQTESRWPRISYALLAATAAGLAVLVAAWTLSGRFAVPSQQAQITVARPSTTAAPATREAGTQTGALVAANAARAGAVARSRGRAERHRAVAQDRGIFEAVKVTPEKEAVIRLYDLLQSGQIDPRLLLTPVRNDSQTTTIAPLVIKPLSIRPIEMDSDSSAAPG
jgi:anti-sigma factor RsiW